MKLSGVIAQISSIRNKANDFLLHELHKQGLKGIAPSHGLILHVLFKNDAISMKEMTARINKKKNTVTVLIDKLIAYGFVEKTPDQHDRRTVRISLTHKGRSLEKPVDYVSRKLIEKACRGFTEDQRRLLATLLDKLERNFS